MTPNEKTELYTRLLISNVNGLLSNGIYFEGDEMMDIAKEITKQMFEDIMDKKLGFQVQHDNRSGYYSWAAYGEEHEK